MRRVHLEAASDHVEALAKVHDPVGAIKEIIWNALDADATAVAVEFEVVGLNVIDKVIVTDDGLGITPESAVAAFERIGGSWKKGVQRTPGLGRRMHGNAGQGRLRGFALGERVRWTSVADGIDGRARSQISATGSAKNDFTISDPILTPEPTGTVFEAWGRQGPKLDQLLSDGAIGRIRAEFATYLTVYSSVEVYFNGQLLDPQAAINQDITYPITFVGPDNEQMHAALRVVEWVMKTPRELHLCDADGMTIDITAPGIQAPNFEFTAYVLWIDMPQHAGVYLLGESEDTVVGRLIEAAKSHLRDHFKERSAEQRSEVIDRWKASGSYPYPDEPANEAERIERDTFDIVATTVHRQMPRPVRQQKVALALIREALKHQPDNVHHILDELFRLSVDDKADLDRLLNRTTLSGVIKASSNVADRLDFLAALSHMVFDPEARKVVKERTELHKILATEAWLFGEHYSLLVSDQALDTVLDRHLAAMDRTSRSPSPVRRADGSVGIVDLMLSRSRRDRRDHKQHLIVELKAPRVVVGTKELDQIKSYAQAVAFDPQFADTRTEWDFWLITTKMAPVVRMEARQKGKDPGLVLDYDTDGIAIRVWLKSWSEIIEECRDRLHFFQEHLQHDPTIEHAMEYLNRKHSAFTPNLLQLPPQRADPSQGRIFADDSTDGPQSAT